MFHIHGLVHGLASIGCVILGAVITDVVRKQVEIYHTLTEAITTLLTDTAQLPVEEEVSSIALSVGMLMFVWVVLYELQRA